MTHGMVQDGGTMPMSGQRNEIHRLLQWLRVNLDLDPSQAFSLPTPEGWPVELQASGQGP